MIDLSHKTFGPIPVAVKDGNAELRVLREDDISPAYVSGMNDPEVRRFVSVDKSAYDATSIRAFVRDNWERGDCLLFGVFLDGAHRGNVRLHDCDGTDIWLGIALFDRTVWGRGLGTGVIAAASAFALTVLSCASVRAGIDRENTVSMAAFKKAGFVVVTETGTGAVLARFPAQGRQVADGAR